MKTHTVLAQLTIAAALCCPSLASAQYGRDAVASRIVVLANRDAPGATLVGQVEAGRLAQGVSATRSYQLKAGSCYWFLAAGDGNVHDIDVHVRRKGVVVARDQAASRDAVVPGERPYCASEAQRVQIQVTAVRGGGTYAVGVYSGSAPAPTKGVDMHAVLDRAAGRYATGMGQAGPPRVARVAAGEDLEQAVTLAGGMCYRFVAVGGPGVTDIGLQVYQGAAEVAHDDAVAPEAVAGYCTTAETPVRMRIRMLGGEGMVALAPYAGGAQHGAGAAGSAAAQRVAVAPVGGQGQDFLARQIRTRHGQVGQGRLAATDVQRVTLGTSQDRSFPVRLEAGRCYTLVAVGMPSVRDLDLYLANPSGMEIASDTGPANHATISTNPCPQWSGQYSVRLRVHAGYGPVAVQVFGN